MTKNYWDKTITYKELDEIINEVMEGYLNMLRVGNMSFSEYAILENVLLKLNEGLKEKREEWEYMAENEQFVYDIRELIELIYGDVEWLKKSTKKLFFCGQMGGENINQR